MPADHSRAYIERDPLSPRPGASPAAVLLTAVLFLLVVVGSAYAMNEYSLDVAVAAGAAVALSVLCFVRVKWVLYLLIFACLFSPELRIGEVLGRASKRPVTIRVEDVLLVVIAITWLARTAVHKELGLMLHTPLNQPIFLYILACVVATAAGIGFGWVTERMAASLFVLKYIQYFVLFFMVVNHIETRRDVLTLVAAGVLTYFAVCIYGLAQIPGEVRPTMLAEYHSEPNTLAGYVLFMIGICSGLLLVGRSAVDRIIWGLLCVVGLVLLGYTLSRSGWAGLFGVAAVLVALGRHKLAVVASLFVVCAVLALVSFEIEWLPEPIEERVNETRGVYQPWPGMPPPVTLLGMELDPSASERYRSYQAALTTWVERGRENWLPFLLGSGVLGGRPFVDGQYVRVLVETGLFGLTAFVILLVAIWRQAWRAYWAVSTTWYKGLALGYLAGFAGLLVHALAANTFIIVRIMEPFFIFTGIVILLPIIDRGGREPGEPQTA
jgi:hypothetical protein